MLFERLELVNFEGYRKAEIRFTEGLNIITGRNSTGKTAILEALIFALYGMVPGVEKRLLVSKLQGTTNKMSVKLSARIDDKKIEILREGRLVERKDKTREFRTERLSLKIDGKEKPVSGEEDLKREIIKLTGMGVKMFTNLIYAKQGELTNILEPKKEDMDLILGITLMKELVEQIDSVKKRLEKYGEKDAKTCLEMLQEQQLPQLTNQINQLNNQVANLSKEVEDLEKIVKKARSEEVKKLIQQIEQRDSLLKSINEKKIMISGILSENNVTSIEELEKKLNELIDEEEKLKINLNELKEEKSKIEDICKQLESKLPQIEVNLKRADVTTIEELKEKIVSLKKEYDQLIKEHENAKDELNEVERRKNELEGTISRIKKEIESHEKLLAEGVAECPTCGQKVNSELVKQIVNNKKCGVEQLSKKLENVNAQYSDLKEKVDKLNKRILELDRDLKDLNKTYNEIIKLLEGDTIEELNRKLVEVNKNLNKIKDEINKRERESLTLENNEQKLKKAIEDMRSLEKNKGELEEKLKKCLEEIRSTLNILVFPFEPEDEHLREKIAEILPLSPEMLEKKEQEFHNKSEQLKELKEGLENLMKQEKRVRDEISYLQKRLDKAKVCDSLKEIIEAGIEEWRERMLRCIADEALRVYETLTDQRVYRAFRINKDDYTVEVLPAYLEGYIPAKRVGGGHQTLIALAVRIALLNVLNNRSLLILDEPTYGVDSENLPQLMSYFSEVAKKIKQTILVTHYGLGEEEAANIIKVKIAEGGSSIVTSK
jgi:exonuclease SbcC